MKFLKIQLLRMWPIILSRRYCSNPMKASKLKPNTEQLNGKLKLANDTIVRALNTYKPHEIMLCFNGGKDCTVLLDLLSKHQLAASVPIICVKMYDSFEEVDRFIEGCRQRYKLQLHFYEGALKLAIEQALADHPKVRAGFLGCRRSDPGCAQLTDMMPTDNGWPELMRIFPLLEWTYGDVWTYLRSNNVPYCSLYDKGFTSIGEKYNTSVNASLLVYDEQQGKLVYRPAYELKDLTEERSNRRNNKNTDKQPQVT